MSLTDALKSLSEAHGPKALITAFASLQGQVKRARKAAAQQYGALAQTYLAAMQIWDAQKADGVSRAERIAGLEKTLRAVWPQTREWHYLCPRCADTGYEFRVCPEVPCGRPFKLPDQHSDDHTGQGRCQVEHGYVAPCWCAKGQVMRRGLAKTAAPVDPEKDFKQAGFTKAGRR